jgi:polyhydroxybutyrate depolymerase
MQILTFNRFNELADRDGFIALYPDGVGKVWNDGRKIQGEMAHREKIDDLGFLSALIDQFENQFGADPRRVYVTGISNGAMMSTRLACELSEKIAAAAPVAGSIPQVLMGACHSKFPVSMLFINGDEDPLVPFKGGQVRAFGQDRGEIIPVEEAARFWAQRDGCPPKPKEELLPNQAPEDGTTVKKISYAPGPSGDEVILYVIQGGGHTWPKGWKYAGEWLVGRVSHQLEACDVIWEFFKNHPKNKKSKAEG